MSTVENDVPSTYESYTNNALGEAFDDSEHGSRKFGLSCPLLKQLKKTNRPTEDDAELAKRYQNGDMSASYLLLIKHYKFILKRILEITQGHWFSEDILQAGAVGMFEAAKRFDPSKGFTFLTYAGPWINKYIYIEVRNELLPMGGICIGRDMKEKLFNYIKLVMQGLSDAEIREEMKISDKKLMELKIMNITAARIKSLDVSITNNDNEEGEEAYNFVEDPTPLPSDVAEFEELRAYIEDKVKELAKTNKVAADILTLRLGLNGEEEMTRSDICNKLNLRKNLYIYQERVGNKFLRKSLITDGWYADE